MPSALPPLRMSGIDKEDMVHSGPDRLAAEPHTSAEPSASWIVKTDSWQDYYALGPVARRTAQRVYHPDRHSPARTAYTDLHNVLFLGAEEQCRALAQRLTSSKALMKQEEGDARQRHRQRVDKLVAAAREATPTLVTATGGDESPGRDQ